MILRLRPSYSRHELRAIVNPTSHAVDEFERGLADFFGMKYALVFPYGRSAIYSTLRALDRSGQVVQPAYNCVVVTHATVLAGYAPVFVDNQPDDPNQDPQRMIDSVSNETVAVIPTSIFGQAFDVYTLTEAIRKKNPNALVLTDCCQAFDATWNGRYLAQAGDGAFLAFGIGKPMTTLFGGALLTNRDDLAQRVRSFCEREFTVRKLASVRLLLYGMASWLALATPLATITDWLEFSDSPLHRYLTKFRSRSSIALPSDVETQFTAFQARVGLAQLARAVQFTERRREIAGQYLEFLSERREFCRDDWNEGSSFGIFALRLRSPRRRNAFLDALRREGVQPDTILNYVIPLLDCYKSYGIAADAFSNAKRWAEQVVNLPVYPSLKNSEVEKVLCALERVTNKVLRNE